GVLGIDGQALTFTGMEPIDFVDPIDEVRFEGSTGDDVITLAALTGAGALVNQIFGTSDGVPFEVLRFANPIVQLIIEGLGGTDLITVEGVDADFAASVAIFGDSQAKQNRPCDPAEIP